MFGIMSGDDHILHSLFVSIPRDFMEGTETQQGRFVAPPIPHVVSRLPPLACAGHGISVVGLEYSLE